jgi:Hedgehog amino-terminal signalling domain
MPKPANFRTMRTNQLAKTNILNGLTLIAAVLLAACAPAPAFSTPLPIRSTPTPQVIVAFLTQVPTPTPTGPVVEISPTPLYALGAGQHIAANGSYTATETEAAGPMICQIHRNSYAFTQFIGVFDDRILWSAGELPPYGDEDHRMHPAMLKPLTQLVDLVQAEWNGETKIMVTEAYDSLLDHNIAQSDTTKKYSLHFEGRSIDMIPWPPPEAPAIMSRFCALAHTAGFDWVHNEQDHCHASVNAISLCGA